MSKKQEAHTIYGWEDVTYEVYIFKHKDRTWRKKFSCLTDAVRYIEIWSFHREIQIFDSEGTCLYPARSVKQ